MRRYGMKKASEDVISIVGDEGVIFVNNLIILDPMKVEGVVDWVKWIEGLRMAAFFNQHGNCLCGEKLRYEGELHHGLVSRSDLMGARDDAKNHIINHSYNVIFLHKKCHDKAVRHRCFKFLCDLFGEDEVRKWYDSIQDKRRFRRF